MSDSQILTAAISIIVPVSTVMAGLFLQDHRATALRTELTDAIKEIRTDIRDIRKDIAEIRDRIISLDRRVERRESRSGH